MVQGVKQTCVRNEINRFASPRPINYCLPNPEIQAFNFQTRKLFCLYQAWQPKHLSSHSLQLLLTGLQLLSLVSNPGIYLSGPDFAIPTHLCSHGLQLLLTGLQPLPLASNPET